MRIAFQIEFVAHILPEAPYSLAYVQRRVEHQGYRIGRARAGAFELS